MRVFLIFAAFFLTACQVTIGTSNVALSTSTQPYRGSSPSLESSEFVRCPNRPSKTVRRGFESSLCYD